MRRIFAIGRPDSGDSDQPLSLGLAFSGSFPAYYPYYLHTGEVDAMGWLEKNARPDDVVFSSLTIGPVHPGADRDACIPGALGADIGFLYQTKNVDELLRGNIDPAAQDAILKDGSVDYVFWGPAEKSTGSRAAQPIDLKTSLLQFPGHHLPGSKPALQHLKSDESNPSNYIIPIPPARSWNQTASLRLAGLAGLSVFVLVSRIPFASKILYHWDSVNFAYAMSEFNLAKEQPQPPGYIIYVWLCRLVAILLHDPQTVMVTDQYCRQCRGGDRHVFVG